MCIFRLSSFCFGYCIRLDDPLFSTATNVWRIMIHKAENVMESKIILRTVIRSEVFQKSYCSRHAGVTLEKLYTFVTSK